MFDDITHIQILRLQQQQHKLLLEATIGCPIISNNIIVDAIKTLIKLYDPE